MKLEIELSEMDFRMIRDFIHQKIGVLLKDDKKSFLRMKLSPRIETLGLSSFGEYLQYVKYGPRPEREAMKLIALITNNETYFFREHPQLYLFRDAILSEIKQRKMARDDKSVRILSAGCSTGEEVYTLAMLAFETGSFFWGWDFQIQGMDVSEKAVETAQRGIYYGRSFRMTPPGYHQKFFLPNSGEHFEAKDSIRRMTSFQVANLTAPETWKGLPPFDVIFCRNVLIYFSEDKIKAAIQYFYDALAPGGYLFLGHSETLTGIFDDFEILRFPETIIYRKKEN